MKVFYYKIKFLVPYPVPKPYPVEVKVPVDRPYPVKVPVDRPVPVQVIFLYSFNLIT